MSIRLLKCERSGRRGRNAKQEVQPSAEKMAAAGASRIGASASVKIVEAAAGRAKTA